MLKGPMIKYETYTDKNYADQKTVP
jgi:hypothetical protein